MVTLPKPEGITLRASTFERMNMIVVSLFGKIYNVETKTSKDGKPFVSATIRDSVRNAQGEWESRFIRLTAYGVMADRLNECPRGTVACVEGVMEPSIYVDKGGTPRLSLDVRVDRIRKAPSYPDSTDAADTSSGDNIHAGLDDPNEIAPPIASANPFARSGLA